MQHKSCCPRKVRQADLNQKSFVCQSWREGQSAVNLPVVILHLLSEINSSESVVSYHILKKMNISRDDFCSETLVQAPFEVVGLLWPTPFLCKKSDWFLSSRYLDLSWPSDVLLELCKHLNLLSLYPSQPTALQIRSVQGFCRTEIRWWLAQRPDCCGRTLWHRWIRCLQLFYSLSFESSSSLPPQILPWTVWLLRCDEFVSLCWMR